MQYLAVSGGGELEGQVDNWSGPDHRRDPDPSKAAASLRLCNTPTRASSTVIRLLASCGFWEGMGEATEWWSSEMEEAPPS
ncbi:unnamed protein product [Linum trigynum]|uniref:Uncharacterized protein n=1 Tax=Linum trigynum TaxID=586398 RepID=A0AAV2FF83_9ROSI